MSTHENIQFLSTESFEVQEARASFVDGTCGLPNLQSTLKDNRLTVDWSWEGGPYAAVPDSAWPQLSLLVAMHWCPFQMRVLGYDAEQKVWFIKRDGHTVPEVPHGSD